MLAVQETHKKTQFHTVEAVADGGRGSAKTPTRTVRVTHQQGLHLRPCSAIVNTVSQHRANVMVQRGNQAVDAASILGLLSLAAPQGAELILSATGAEAEEALQAVVGLIVNGCEGADGHGAHPRLPR